MRKLSRRSSAIVLAGVLAFAGAACGEDEPEADIDVTEPADGGDTTVEEETTTEMETEMETETGAETDTEMGTETETATE